MKKVTLLMMIVCLAAARDVAALEWEAKATLNVVPRPSDWGEEGWVKARSTHRVSITEVGVLDQPFPIQFRVELGELQHNGFPMRRCATSWVWAADAAAVACTTAYSQDPCEDGVWDAMTRGRLRGHPKGGVKVAFAPSQFVDCACI